MTLDGQIIRDLWDQWEWAHAEFCGWPHDGSRPCHWPPKDYWPPRPEEPS